MKSGIYGRRLQTVFVAIACCFVLLFAVLLTYSITEAQRSDFRSSLQYTASAKSSSVRITAGTIMTALQTIEESESAALWAQSASPGEYHYYAAKLLHQIAKATVNLSLIDFDVSVTQNNPESFVVNHMGTLSKQLFYDDYSGLPNGSRAQIEAHFEHDTHEMFVPIYNGDVLEGIYYITLQNTAGEDLLYFTKIPIKTLCGNEAEQTFAVYSEQNDFFAYSTADEGTKQSLDDAVNYMNTQQFSPLSSYYQVTHKGSELFQISALPLPLRIVYLYRFSVFSAPHILVYLFTAVLVFAAVSLLVFLSVSKALYHPLGEAIADAAPQRAPNERIDEFKIIRQNASAITQLNTKLRTVIDENNAFYIRRYYRELLFGIPDLDCPLTAQQMSASYCVALVELQVRLQQSVSDDWMLHLQKNQIYLYTESKQPQDNVYCFSEGPITCAVLIECTSQQKAMDILSGLFSLPELEAEIKIALSDVQNQVVQICDCYRQALHIMEYRYKIPRNTIATSATINELAPVSYYYPLVVETRIIQTTALGNPSCIALYDDIIRENSDNQSLSPSARRNLLFALIGTLMRVFQELKTTPQELLGQEIDFGKLYAEPDFAKCTEKLRTYIQNTVLCIQQKQNNHDDELLQKMLDFITHNYSDDIMLNDIAAYCGIAPTYCSTLFKRLSNDNFKNFLNRYRIDRACEILRRTPSAKIGDVGVAVGFNSANSFIRAFSKAMGVTPKAYADKVNESKAK